MDLTFPQECGGNSDQVVTLIFPRRVKLIKRVFLLLKNRKILKFKHQNIERGNRLNKWKFPTQRRKVLAQVSQNLRISRDCRLSVDE